HAARYPPQRDLVTERGGDAWRPGNLRLRDQAGPQRRAAESRAWSERRGQRVDRERPRARRAGGGRQQPPARRRQGGEFRPRGGGRRRRKERDERRGQAAAPRGPMSPSRLFILRPVATSLLMVAILLGGAIAYRLLPLSALPEVDYPTIQVVTFYPGASPDV